MGGDPNRIGAEGDRVLKSTRNRGQASWGALKPDETHTWRDLEQDLSLGEIEYQCLSYVSATHSSRLDRFYPMWQATPKAIFLAPFLAKSNGPGSNAKMTISRSCSCGNSPRRHVTRAHRVGGVLQLNTIRNTPNLRNGCVTCGPGLQGATGIRSGILHWTRSWNCSGSRVTIRSYAGSTTVG